MIIAEIGQAHEGSLGIAHSYIDALAKTGIDCIKFQMHIAEAESSDSEPFRVAFSYEDRSRYEYWKRMEFTFDQWKGLKDHCSDLGLGFLVTPFSNMAIELLETLGVEKYKVGSGELNNSLMLEKLIRTGKPLIISTGMSSIKEIDSLVLQLKKRNTSFSLMQCTTNYPTLPSEWGLRYIPVMKNKYNVPVGFSDHSGEIHACIAAAALGAEIFEFHVVFDKRMFGPDSKASLTIEQVKALTKGVKDIGQSFIEPYKKKELPELKAVFNRSLCVNKNLKRGHIIQFEDLEAKKGTIRGIAPSDFHKVVGKTLIKNKEAWSIIAQKDLI